MDTQVIVLLIRGCQTISVCHRSTNRNSDQLCDFIDGPADNLSETFISTSNCRLLGHRYKGDGYSGASMAAIYRV
ncbi:hypothetical protein BDZ94DRAFT_1277329 [Collybia nuda]|uniref:Uncharacterized protein n=1 Tax=Collybia nuda TaxID=64659 RepID=A0A9P6C8B4_9AGAR|nr:hypothetical protein BDZ94DRAFT_1277329 [Collybia nuda]